MQLCHSGRKAYLRNLIPDPFYFHQTGVEGWTASHIGKSFRGKGVNANAVGHELRPVEAGRHYPRLYGAIDQRGQTNLAAIIEDADGVSLGNSAPLRVSRMHLQFVRFWFERLMGRKIAKR